MIALQTLLAGIEVNLNTLLEARERIKKDHNTFVSRCSRDKRKTEDSKRYDGIKREKQSWDVKKMKQKRVTPSLSFAPKEENEKI